MQFSKLNESVFIYRLNFILIILLSILPVVLISGPFLSDFIIVTSSIIFLLLVVKKKEYFYLTHPLSIIFWIWCFYLILRSLFAKDILLSLESSLFYFRFGLFSLSIWYILNNNKNFINFFFFFLFIAFVLIIFDSFFQYINGTNIIGIPYTGGRVSSFFGEEKILGSFLSRLFPIFIGLLIYINFSKTFKIFAIIFFFIFIDSLLYISGERTAFFYLILTSFLIILLINEFKYLRIITFLISLLIIFFISIYDPAIKNRMLDKTLIQTNLLQDKMNLFSIQHQVIYESSFRIFKDNKIFGIGTKMFREICKEEKYIVKTELDHSINGCQTSPHNYYLQLLTETGIIGAIPFIILFFFIIFIFIKQTYYVFFSKKKYVSDLQICLYIALFISVWPLVPTGNFFNNYISIFHFLPIGFLIFSYDKKKYISNL